jgi:hypothetical protein
MFLLHSLPDYLSDVTFSSVPHFPDLDPSLWNTFPRLLEHCFSATCSAEAQARGLYVQSVPLLTADSPLEIPFQFEVWSVCGRPSFMRVIAGYGPWASWTLVRSSSPLAEDHNLVTCLAAVYFHCYIPVSRAAARLPTLSTSALSSLKLIR